MVKEIIKGIITLFIWSVCGAIAIAVNVDVVSFWGAILAIVALAMAAGATGMIWAGDETDSAADASVHQGNNDDYREKRKRGQGDTKAEMLALMDEDERLAFKQALQQQMLESSARLGG